jgi:hypothetical protein
MWRASVTSTTRLIPLARSTSAAYLAFSSVDWDFPSIHACDAGTPSASNNRCIVTANASPF